MGDGVSDFLFAAEKTLRFEVFEDFLAAFFGREALVIRASGGGHAAVFADDLDALEIMTLTNFEVVEIVGGGDFHGTGAVRGVGVLVGDYGDDAVGQGEMDEAADEVLVTLVVGIDGDSGVAEDGFGAGSADDDFGVLDIGIIIRAVVRGGAELIGDFPEVAVFVFVLNFDIGEGGLMLRAEIDEFFAAVDHAVVPHFLEGFVNAGDNVFIESKSQVGPGAGGAEGANLEFHVAALLFDKVPDAGVEFIAIKFEAGVAFFFKGAFVDDPGLEAGVVGTRDIPGRLTAKTIITSQGIFEGDGEAVTDMEVAVRVRRGHDDRIAVVGVAFGAVDDRGFRLESAGSLPFGINARFKISRNITLCETHDIIIAQIGVKRGRRLVEISLR